MKSRLTLQQRLIIPVVLLGLVTLLSNILAVFSINNVNSNAGVIVDEYMTSEACLNEISRSMMEIHRLALSHIVAADHATMIHLVQEIKTEEAALDQKLADYEKYVTQEDSELYRSLLEGYGAFKHSLVGLVCASADSKTTDAYAMANGDVAAYSSAVEEDIDALYASVSAQAQGARSRLSAVYVSSLITSGVTLVLGILLVAAAFRIIQRSVITPIRDAMKMLQGSSERISGVVGDVRHRVQSYNRSVQALFDLTSRLSAALEEIAAVLPAFEPARPEPRVMWQAWRRNARPLPPTPWRCGDGRRRWSGLPRNRFSPSAPGPRRFFPNWTKPSGRAGT